MHDVPEGIALDYHARCCAEIERLDEQLEHVDAFIESIVLTVNASSFTAEQNAQLAEWLKSVRHARKVLR